MRKIVLAAVCCGASFISHAASGKVGVGAAWDYGFGVTAQFNGNLNATIGNDGLGVDYIFRQQALPDVAPELSWYLSAGAGVKDIFDDSDYAIVNGRALIGLDFNFTKEFDAFAAVGPELRLYTGDYSGNSVRFALDALVGVRYFF